MEILLQLLMPHKQIQDTTQFKLEPRTLLVSLTKGLLLSLSQIHHNLKLLHKQHKQQIKPLHLKLHLVFLHHFK